MKAEAMFHYQVNTWRRLMERKDTDRRSWEGTSKPSRILCPISIISFTGSGESQVDQKFGDNGRYIPIAASAGFRVLTLS